MFSATSDDSFTQIENESTHTAVQEKFLNSLIPEEKTTFLAIPATKNAEDFQLFLRYVTEMLPGIKVLSGYPNARHKP